MESRMNKNRGFSLIELLVAMAILSIIMIMVVQFMSTSSGALSKTKKNLNLQTEAMEIGEQFSDALVQATYIRVCTQDGKLYELDNDLENERKKRQETDKGFAGINQLVVDNFPNYLGSVDERRIILDDSSYKLVDESGAAYSDARSFRILTSGSPEQLYVKPKYIYIQYQKKINGSESKAYVIYYFTSNKIYMDRGDLPVLGTNDGYDDAVTAVDTAAAGNNGLLTESISISGSLPDCYFTANTTKDTVALDILFKDTRYNQYTYNYVETIQLRNSNVLTVAPQKMYKYNGTP